jgi:hypothetical protein
LVYGRANRTDFGSVENFLVFPIVCLTAPPKPCALFPSLSSDVETEHAGGIDVDIRSLDLWRLRDLIWVVIGANDPVAAVDDAVTMDEGGRPT